MTQAREGVLDDATVERRLKEELPHWRLEDGWKRLQDWFRQYGVA